MEEFLPCPLSPCEAEVLECMVRLRTDDTEKLAERLFVAPSTIDRRLARACRRTGDRTRCDLLLRAQGEHWVGLPERRPGAVPPWPLSPRHHLLVWHLTVDRGSRTMRIAAMLQIRACTVKGYIQDMYDEFGVHSRADLILHCQHFGWVPRPSHHPADPELLAYYGFES